MINKLDEKEDIIIEINELNEKYKKIVKKNRRKKIIIIILTIVILILLFLLGIKIGKIDFSISTPVRDEIPIISITDKDIEDNNKNNGDNNNKNDEKDIDDNNKNDGEDTENNNKNNEDDNKNNGEDISDSTNDVDITEDNKNQIQIELVPQKPNDIGQEKNILNIFNNTLFENRKVIAPESKGTFEFYIKNKTSDDINYNISFEDELGEFVNMKYRLKLNGEYIKGTDEQYVQASEINLNKMLLAKNSNDLLSLEWYWKSDDTKDSFVGGLKQDQYYKLQINVVGYKTN